MSRYSIASARAFAARLVDRAAWYSGGAAEQARIAVRTGLVRSGVPIAKEYLQLGCATGNEASGLFSEFTAVLGCLHHYERHRDIYAGLRVNFGQEGLYYEAARGPNWWEYYFEPVVLGEAHGARQKSVALWQHDAFAEAAGDLPRPAAADLVRRHLRPRAPVHDAVDYFSRVHFTGVVIGIHYRGTDKSEESPRVPFEAVAAAVQQARPAAGADGKVFLATDEQACVDYMRGVFPGRVITSEIRRSLDGLPMHKQQGGFQGGLDAVIDCLLLARCPCLVRTASNLGLVATFINPAIPVTVVPA